MKTEITPELKDQLLVTLVNNPNNQRLHVANNVFKIDQDALNMLIRQFEKKGFLTIIQKFSYGSCVIRLEAFAIDFLKIGGHINEDRIVNNELHKLELEIKKLEKDISVHSYNTILQSIGTIAGAFSAAHLK